MKIKRNGHYSCDSIENAINVTATAHLETAASDMTDESVEYCFEDNLNFIRPKLVNLLENPIVMTTHL